MIIHRYAEFLSLNSYCSILPINDCLFIVKCRLAAKKLLQDLQDTGAEANKKEIIDLGCQYGESFMHCKTSLSRLMPLRLFFSFIFVNINDMGGIVNSHCYSAGAPVFG